MPGSISLKKQENFDFSRKSSDKKGQGSDKNVFCPIRGFQEMKRWVVREIFMLLKFIACPRMISLV
jgi:hypothetical protein